MTSTIIGDWGSTIVGVGVAFIYAVSGSESLVIHPAERMIKVAIRVRDRVVFRVVLFSP